MQIESSHSPQSSNGQFQKQLRNIVAVCAFSATGSICSAASIKSDEIEVSFNSMDSIGIGLIDVNYKLGAVRTIIKSIKPNTEAATHPILKPGMILVSVSGTTVEVSSNFVWNTKNK